MKNLKYAISILSLLLVVVCLHISASAQAVREENKLAAISASGSSVRWDVTAAHAGLTVTVAAPDGRIFRQESKGSSAEFSLSDRQGNRLPDGQYTYELRVTPEISKAVKEQLAAARGKDDDAEDVRAARKRTTLPGLVESGSFSLLNGAVIVAGSSEEAGARRVSKVSAPRPVITSVSTEPPTKSHHPLMIAKPDDVIPDDLIVQGSACV